MYFHDLPPEPPPTRPRILPDDGDTGRARDRYTPTIALAVVGVAICGFGLLLTWGVVPWVIGAELFGLALVGLARTWIERGWVTAVAAVAAVAAVVVPFVLPHVGHHVPVEWSVEGEWAVGSSSDLVVTLTVDPVHPGPLGDDDVVHVRARAAATGDLVWSREVNPEDEQGLSHARVHEASGVLVVWGTTDPGFAWQYRAFDLQTGDDLWTSPAGSRAGVVATSGDLLIVESDGRLEGWDARTGEVRWSEAADFRGPPVRPYHRFEEVDYVGLRVPAPVEQPAADVTFRVLDATSGEQHGELSLQPDTLAAVVGDSLIVDDGATAAAADREIGDTDYVPVSITSYALPTMEEVWSTELVRPESGSYADPDPFGTGHSYTVTPDGVLELVAPTDGTISRIPSPRDVQLALARPFGYPVIAQVQWSGGGNAIMSHARRFADTGLVPAAYVDLDGESARAVHVPSSLPEASLPGGDDLDPTPLWRNVDDDIFGRDVPQAYVVDDAGGELALRDVGALPRGAGKLTAHAGMLFTRTDDRLHAIDPSEVR